jgi:GTPase SAR1 family protein
MEKWGKTSIRIKLDDPEAPLPDPDDRTAGLDVVDYEIEDLGKDITGLEDAINFQLKIWDFGGQGRYREVQQLFCSRKSLYLFVTAHDDSPDKQNYVGYKYWLSMVNAYGYDETTQAYSPVIHIVNKIDEGRKAINEEERLKVFPNIYPDFIKISCKDLTNFDQLKAAIRKALANVSSDIFTNPYSNRWLEVKDILERKKENHITFKEYELLCIKREMSKSEALTWINILDRIGSVIYFRNHSELKDWIILNPEWVKEAIYKVLDYDRVIRGRITEKDFPYIWPKNTPEEMQKFISLMLKYKLCFGQKDNFGELNYVIPALLSATPPDLPLFLETPVFQVQFIFDPLIPAGTVNKLIVTLQQGYARKTIEIKQQKNPEPDFERSPISVFQDLMWKNNVIIQGSQGKAYAHLEETWDDHAIYVNFYGENIQPLFEQISSALGILNQEIREAKYLARLTVTPKPWYKGSWRTLEDLNNLEVDIDTLLVRPSESPSKEDEIKRFISQNRIDKALEMMRDLGNYEDEVIGLQQRWLKYQLDKLTGTVSFEDLDLENNRITQGALTLLELIRISR